MVQTKKTNPVPQVTTAKVAPADMMRQAIIYGKATHTAASQLCFASAAYILLVNHFTDTKDKAHMSREKAIEYLEKQIAEQTGVKGNMLALYIRNAGRIVKLLTGSMKMFSPTIQKLGEASKPEEMVVILKKWLEDNLHRRLDSMNEISEALGYKTSRPVPQAKLTPTVAAERIGKAIQTIERKVSKGDLDKTAQRTVAVQVATQFTNPALLAREAIKKVLDADELKALIPFVNEQIKNVLALTKRAESEVNKRTKELVAKGNGKTPGGGTKGKRKTKVQHATV